METKVMIGWIALTKSLMLWQLLGKILWPRAAKLQWKNEQPLEKDWVFLHLAASKPLL